MAKAAGAPVIGTVGTAEKARETLALGADHAIVYTEQDFEAEVKRLTDGAGVHVVYDSVGRTTFDKSLKVLAPRHARAVRPVERAVAPVDPLTLNAGSLFLTRPSLGHYITLPDELRWRASEVFDLAASGALKVRIWVLTRWHRRARPIGTSRLARHTGSCSWPFGPEILNPEPRTPNLEPRT